MPKDDPLLRFIRSKKLLALGCKFDDWYFRFFWYTLKGEISKFREGQVAFMLNSDNQFDNRLEAVLKNYKIYRHSSACDFMKEIVSIVSSAEPENPFRKLVLDRRRQGGIFLSYCSEDIVAASRLFFRLCQEGYDVWFDNMRLKGSADYNKEISKAIGEAQVFVPLLTPCIAEDLEQGKIDHYYNDEWRMAAQWDTMKIIPLAINGYDLRADYHKGFDEIVNKSLTGIDLMDKNGLQMLFNSLNAYLG